MSFIEQLSAIAFLVDFLFGVMFGVVGSASFASRREGRCYSLPQAPPDPLCDGGRVIHGVCIRGDGWVSDALRGAAHASDGGRGGNAGSGAQGQEPER